MKSFVSVLAFALLVVCIVAFVNGDQSMGEQVHLDSRDKGSIVGVPAYNKIVQVGSTKPCNHKDSDECDCNTYGAKLVTVKKERDSSEEKSSEEKTKVLTSHGTATVKKGAVLVQKGHTTGQHFAATC